MATRGITLIEYAAEDGVILRLEVSAEIAEALKDKGARLKEVTFTDLGGRFELVDEKVARRRVQQQPEGKKGIWEGPRFHFDVILGTGRTTWFGGHILDEDGRCGLCHDAKLGPGVYCGSCNRTGRDREIPKAVPKPLEPVEKPERQAYVPPPKKETRREKRAREAQERRKAG